MLLPSVHRRERGSVSQSPTPTDSALAGDSAIVPSQRSHLCSLYDSETIKLVFGRYTTFLHATRYGPKVHSAALSFMRTMPVRHPPYFIADLVLSDAPGF
jgi:hypothetical protein